MAHFGILCVSILVFCQNAVQVQSYGSSLCGIPNIIPGTIVDQSKRMGTAYPYLYKDGFPPAVNPVLTYAAMGQTLLPGTSVPALAVAQSLYQYNSQDDLTCGGLFLQSYYTVDGREIGLTFTSDAPNAPYSDVYYDIYIDDKFEFSYQCGAANYVTGLCEDPHFYLNTYQRPDLMSSATKAYIKATVNLKLAPYCMDSSVLKEYIFEPDLPFCNEQQVPAPGCYSDLIESLNATITEQNTAFNEQMRLALQGIGTNLWKH